MHPTTCNSLNSKTFATKVTLCDHFFDQLVSSWLVKLPLVVWTHPKLAKVACTPGKHYGRRPYTLGDLRERVKGWDGGRRLGAGFFTSGWGDGGWRSGSLDYPRRRFRGASRSHLGVKTRELSQCLWLVTFYRCAREGDRREVNQGEDSVSAVYMLVRVPLTSNQELHDNLKMLQGDGTFNAFEQPLGFEVASTVNRPVCPS